MEVDGTDDYTLSNRNMIDHVFLPRKLPGTPIDLLQTELSLLKLMTTTVNSFDNAVFPSSVQQLFTNMMHLHCIDSLNPSAISKKMANLKLGDMLGIYVRAQNCGLFIHVVADGEVTLSTFGASLPNEVVYGDNIDNDIQVDYPTRAIKVKLSQMLKSEEFAKLIHHLNSKPMDRAMSKTRKAGHEFSEERSPSHPMYVSQWLMAVASSRFTEVNNEYPVISKKIRDEVVMGQDLLPFRRSGFYTTMKVFLQLGLTIKLGDGHGKFLYKLCLLKFMCALCNNDRTADDDVLMQMIAKMARRTDKIEKCAATAPDLGIDLLAFKDGVKKDAIETVRSVRKKLNERFEAIQANERRLSDQKPLPRLDFERDITHQIPKLTKYFIMRDAEIVWEAVDNFPRPRRIIRHSWETKTFPDVQQLKAVSGEIDTLQLLADFEHWILNLGTYYHSSSSMRQLAKEYMLKAQSFYQNDCIGYSRMVLVMLKIIQVMDKAAVQEHDILRTHFSGINPKIIEKLLLSSQFHLKIATELQIYFEDRNANASYPGLLEENMISTVSFSVRFAANNYEMERVRRQIIDMGERRVMEKRWELREARDKIREMRRKAAGLSHEYWYYYHASDCEKCLLQEKIDEYRVEVYERPLKPEIHNQNAVVFELLLPQNIECLRDVLHLFVTKCYQSSLNSIDLQGKWTEYEQISGYNRSHPENVFLGSTTKLVKKSHYGKPKHPDQPDDDFIVDNGYNCTFYGGIQQSLPIDRSQQSVKKLVTLSVQTSSLYNGLQWTLVSTSHTQNSVLTRQCQCPQKLSLNEFVNFGSLRADGHRLQLRNLYRALETEGLSFETESVLALVMQSLWEIGPMDAARSQWYRESHADFSDGVFAMAMINLLEKFVHQQESNWKHPLRLIVVVTIAVKIFEINGDESNANRIVKLLIYVREIAIKWISLITETIGRCNDESNRAVVYANLVEVAICGIFTYNVSRYHEFFAKIFEYSNEHSSVFAWLQFMVTINNNKLLRGGQYYGIKRLLIRMVHTIGVNAEAKLKSLIEKNPDEVYRFVQSQWSESRAQMFEPIQECASSPQIIFMAVPIVGFRNYVQIDLISGEFLVNNLPVARLPKNITENKLFQRVFGSTIFEVQPSHRSYSTVYQYNGFNYIFRIENGLLIIIEQCENGNDRELIPPEYLTGEIPYLLVENHSHWWNKDRKTIEFRPKTFGSKDFSTPSVVQYELDLSERLLKHLKTQKLLLDVCSESYKRITQFMSRLEQTNYIHVLMDAPAKAKVHLMRMNLKFVIDCTEVNTDNAYDVESNEYCGMRVSQNQTFGTLIGLRNGLMLESIPTVNESNSKLFIVPHGHVSIARADRHVSVEIDLHTSLHSPTFFDFKVDDECKYIKANNFSGWFYLAYLHAVTSHPLADPFTGMTGTERALQILQSARVWSSSSYDGASSYSLRLIAALSPDRTFYPSHLRVIQRIQWHQAISSAAAQDSYRFVVNELHSGCSQSNLILNKRDHMRHRPFYSNCNVSEEFVPATMKMGRFQATEDDINVPAVRQLSTVYDENRFIIPYSVKNSIFSLLIGLLTLTGVSNEVITNVIDFSRSTDLANLWIRLYDCARLRRLTRENFQLILGFLAYEGNDINHLFILQAIAANAAHFTTIYPPEFESYCETGRYKFEEATVEHIIESTQIGLEKFLEKKLDYWGKETYKRRKYDFEYEYNSEVESITRRLVNHIKNKWPCDEVGYVGLSSDKLSVQKSIEMIDPLLHMWNNNRKLVLFIRKVEDQLLLLYGLGTSAFSPNSWSTFNVGVKPFPKYNINFEEKLSRNFSSPNFTDDVDRAREIFINNIVDEERTLADWWDRFTDISTPSNEMHLVHSGLYPHLMPSLVLPKLLHPMECDEQKCVIGAIAVMTTREQRTQRIRCFEHQPQMELSLRRELKDQPHLNWKPHERPEWLLFEIEMNLSIRRIQVEIAERMIEPPGKKHSVMQLNMGEGKTAVIVPILAAVLADGKQLCSVTVLKSLFETNLRSLRQCLGGLLNQRVYTFPCRRDMQTKTDLLAKYEECKRKRGVVMTLPEYRLSFQLKIYEAARKQDTARTNDLLRVHNWLNQNARHILDESDAILDAKYQLIYTVGAQLPPDAGALRWTIVQAVLKRVPNHMRQLFQKYGDQAIEFCENYQIDGVDYGQGDIANRPEAFRSCRLLNEKIYSEISDALIDDFLNGELNILFPETPSAVRELIRNVLRDPKISQEEHAKLLIGFEESPQKSILILSGLFKFGVLKLSLMKRWRVNYGVKTNGCRKMAVPFRAKDVAADMTEFGHPDVAICLTHLSYYYSGLTDAQLYDTFNVLELTENPEEIYQEWIKTIPKDLIPNSIASYSGINLSDPGQRDTVLFPLLRYNMYVIDYWLAHLVFPREAKIFEGKLMCSAWDLCTEHFKHICTGFSGTNDTKLVLPEPISQNDLPELEATNENVRQTLLREENNYYRALPSNVSGQSILEQLVVDKIPVLLDSGALMLELNNEQAAREWLKLVPDEDYDAAIFFSPNDILMTIDRNDFIIEFESSVYRERLKRCLVYLDDIHTRGTDLKFPSEIRACVTLAGRITRDKVVQACMRMRMLGQGHMVSFWASLEADIGIREVNKLAAIDDVSTLHVLEYICENSRKFEKDGLVHWAAAGLNYAQKLAVHKHVDTSKALNLLGERCTDPENTPLKDMYGAKVIEALTSISQQRFDRLADVYKDQQQIFDWINGIGHKVVSKLKENIPDEKRYTQLLDEEQEKELEHELEEQREVCRPPSIPPMQPNLNPLLLDFFNHGQSHRSFIELKRQNGLRKLPLTLARTTLFSMIESQLAAWDDNIFVTKDFLSVAVLSASGRDDEFIRPVWWVARVIQPNASDVFVLLSTFECNALLPTFRSSKKSVLHMFCPKLSMPHSDLMDDANLQIPSNSANGNIQLPQAVQIAMFAGSMYFNNQQEEKAYCNFMGFLPRPRIDEYQRAFEEGAIRSNGYVPLEHRQRFAELAEVCLFNENPDKIAIGIIERRHGYLRANSHVSSLLVEGKRVRWNHNEQL